MILSVLAAAVLSSTEPSAADLAVRFVQVQQALPGEQPTFEGWTRAQLQAEARRLEDERPGLGGPIAMMAVGGAIGVIDLVVVFLGGVFALLTRGGFDPGFTIGVSIVGLVAAGLLIAGGILLRGLSYDRNRLGQQLDRVNQAIERLSAPVEPPRDIPPAMQPPSPQQVRFSTPMIGVTLARF